MLHDHSYVAFADELSASPDLLTSWAEAIDGSDPVTLVILPGNWNPDRVIAEVPAMLAEVGIGDDPGSANVALLTGPLTIVDYERISGVCRGVFGSSRGPQGLSRLPQVDLASVTSSLKHAQGPVDDDERPLVRTFDVFDTLIARRCVEARRVFDVIAERAGIEGFVEARRQAERNVAHARHDLDSIYSELGRMLSLEPVDVERLKELEVAAELEQVIPIAENLAKVRDGDLLVSDMYLPSGVIRSLLDRCELTKQVGLIVTNDGKHSGTVWPELDKRVRIEVHEGDNEHSDVHVPGSRGIQVRHSTVHQPNPVEAFLREAGLGSLGEFCRELRLATWSDDSDVRLVQLAQADLNIPILLIATVLLLRVAQRDRMRHILFSSRDCWCWLPFFRDLSGRLAADCSAEYFFTSRITRRHPSESYLAYARERILPGSMVVDLVGTGWSLAHLAQRLGIDDLPVFLIHELTSLGQYESSAPTPDTCRIEAVLSGSDPALRSALFEASNQADHGSLSDVLDVCGRSLPRMARDDRPDRVRELVDHQLAVMARAHELIATLDLDELVATDSQTLTGVLTALYRQLSTFDQLWELYRESLQAEDRVVMAALTAL